MTQSAEAPGGDIAETDTWVQVTGVFDAQEPWEWTDPADSAKTETRYGRLHLYVGEFDQPSETASGFTTPSTAPVPWPWAAAAGAAPPGTTCPAPWRNCGCGPAR